MRHVLAATVLLVALSPACTCTGSVTHLSPDDAARACVVLQACFPNEWRTSIFGGSLARCTAGTTQLPPSPGALIGDQAVTTGLEAPLSDIYRCVLAAGGDCAKAAKCWSRSGRGGTCTAASLERGTCDGTVLSGCTADGFVFDVDCAKYGGTCHLDNIWFATVGVCDLGNCPAKTQCYGPVAEACEGQGLWRGDCSRMSLSCVIDADAGAKCDTTQTCDGGVATCDGSTVVSCSFEGKPTRLDCARNPTLHRCEAGKCVESGNECVVNTDSSTCDGTKVKFCQDGVYRSVDCVSLGFGACKAGACCVASCECTPTTCAAAGKNCGTISDGCGGTLSCGTCTAPQTCGVSNVCGTACTPTTCLARGNNCGSAANGCGGTLSCGTCTAPQTCGGGGSPNVCGCTPATTCPGGQNCGTASNGCGGTLNCGTCSPPQTCGGGGAPNVCGACTPTTCGAQGWNCGTAPDGCGGVLASCGSCNPSRTCGAAAHNVCAMGSCTPTSCAAQGKTCGVISDGCASTLNCGTCAAPQTCAANVCQ